MSNLFDIGKSGLQSYQRALAVTGQNIANINTDGYKRREIRLEEVSAQQGGITEAPQKTGLGVRMDDIRRSFNEFLLNKARSATAYAATTEVLVNSLSQVENILLPGETGLNTAMTDFFNSMHEVAAAPADRSARTLFIQAGERMAESFRQTSSMITIEQDGITQQINDGLMAVNTLTSELAGLNQMIASSGGSDSNNALLDTRDAIIDKMSNYVEVSVNLEDNGTASVTLGNSGQGPMLVEGSDRAVIGVEKGDLKLSFLLAIGLSETPTSRVTNGSIRGYSDAYSMLAEIRNQLDNLAFLVANTMNAAHREGLDLNGERGGVLFNDITVEVNPHANNRGNTIAELTISDAGLLPTDDITVTYDAAAKVWNAVNSKNTVLASGRQSIDLPGMRIQLNGTAEGGDVFVIKPKQGQAASLSFAITDPNRIAAAASQLVYASTANKGDAQLDVRMQPLDPVSSIGTVQNVFSNGASTIGATGFLRDEAVAVIPPDVAAIELFSLARQPQLKFSITDDELANLNGLDFQLTKANGSTENWSFDLSYSAVNNNAGQWNDAAQVAELLNQGVLRGTNGTDLDSNGNLQTFSMAELGLHVSGSGGRLAVARSEMLDFGASASLRFANSNSRDGVVQAAQDTPSDIQIFTREGRHIAGTSLTPSEISSLLTSDNGFVDGAVYSSSYLNKSGSDGYIGMTVDHKQGASDLQVAVTGTTDTKTLTFNRLNGIDDAAGAPDATSTSAEVLSYTATIGGISHTITSADVSENTSAGIATAMAQAFRKDAPVATMSGAGSLLATTTINLTNDQQTLLTNNGRLSIDYNDVGYLLTDTGNGIAITGGHEEAVTLSYDAVNAVITTQIPSWPSEGDSVTLSFEGAEYTLTYSNGEVQVSGGEEGRLLAYFDSDYRLQVRSATGTLSGENISLPDDAEIDGNTAAAQRFGLISGQNNPSASLLSQSNNFTATDFDITVSGNQLVASHKTTGQTLDASASAESLARQSVTLSDLPAEELIVILTGGGARQITAVFDEAPVTAANAADITVKVTDAAAGNVQFIDKVTGTVMAERTLDSDSTTRALGMTVQLKGAGQDDDIFEISNNAGGTGDGRNIMAMYDLRNQSLSDRMSGSFHDIFNRTVTDLGSAIQSGKLSAEAAEALKDASLEAEASYSGVNLDVEASNLIQQQQAYQASARILSTARDLFQTLIEII